MTPGAVTCAGVWLGGAQLGHGGAGDELAPRAVEDLAGRGAVGVACGARHTVWVLRDGSAASCGEGRDGRLGHGGDRSADRPGRIAGLRDVTAAACGDAHTACVTRRRRLYTFGSGTCGQLGYAAAGGAGGGGRGGGGGGGRVSTLGRGGDGVWHGVLPREVAALGPDREAGGVREVACGGTCTLAVGGDLGVWVWGAGPAVQALTGTEAAVVVPVRPARLASEFVSKLVCGGGHALAVLTKYAPPDSESGGPPGGADGQLSAAG